MLVNINAELTTNMERLSLSSTSKSLGKMYWTLHLKDQVIILATYHVSNLDYYADNTIKSGRHVL